MWLVFARAPLPDAPYWPGRRRLAFVDAVGWPVVWMVLLMQLPKQAGVVGPIVLGLCALGRIHRAVWQNHRYFFTTLRWGRLAAALLLVGLLLKLALPA
jgi:hypothetical protein